MTISVFVFSIAIEQIKTQQVTTLHYKLCYYIYMCSSTGHWNNYEKQDISLSLWSLVTLDGKLIVIDVQAMKRTFITFYQIMIKALLKVFYE